MSADNRTAQIAELEDGWDDIEELRDELSTLDGSAQPTLRETAEAVLSSRWLVEHDAIVAAKAKINSKLFAHNHPPNEPVCGEKEIGGRPIGHCLLREAGWAPSNGYVVGFDGSKSNVEAIVVHQVSQNRSGTATYYADWDGTVKLR